jgi:hypothetical protein
VDISDALARHLTDLTAALDDPGTDLQAVLTVLIDDLRTAVPSLIGLLVTLTPPDADHQGLGAGDGVILNLLPPAQVDAVTTTLLLPLDAMGVFGAGSAVIFYAARPGAFVDLAADTRFAYGLDGQVVLDGHVPPLGTAPDIGVSGLATASLINRALGVLIGMGHTPDDARRVLRHRADRDGIPLHQAAEQILHNPGSPVVDG